MSGPRDSDRAGRSAQMLSHMEHVVEKQGHGVVVVVESTGEEPLSTSVVDVLVSTTSCGTPRMLYGTCTACARSAAFAWTLLGLAIGLVGPEGGPCHADIQVVASIYHQDDTILGSNRSGFDQDKIINLLTTHGVSQLYVNGGDGIHRATTRCRSRVVVASWRSTSMECSRILTTMWIVSTDVWLSHGYRGDAARHSFGQHRGSLHTQRYRCRQVCNTELRFHCCSRVALFGDVNR